MNNIKKEDIEKIYKKLNKEAEFSGYHLNSDIEFTKDLIRGLLINEERYGYWACPCRLASGNKSKDLDMICPCDYRDDDLSDYDCCYCALYVSKDVIDGKKKISPIPDRRLQDDYKRVKGEKPIENYNFKLSKPVWRCKVCGYLCGRDNPPEICPICKAKKERFEKFM